MKRDADCIRVTTGGLVKIDGIPVFRRITRLDGVYLQFLDPNKERSTVRGARLVEVSFEDLIQIINYT
jgi:hypothetical protein